LLLMYFGCLAEAFRHVRIALQRMLRACCAPQPLHSKQALTSGGLRHCAKEQRELEAIQKKPRDEGVKEGGGGGGGGGDGGKGGGDASDGGGRGIGEDVVEDATAPAEPTRAPPGKKLVLKRVVTRTYPDGRVEKIEDDVAADVGDVWLAARRYYADGSAAGRGRSELSYVQALTTRALLWQTTFRTSKPIKEITNYVCEHSSH